MRYAYLGPEGTFCEAALRRFDPGAEAVPAVDVTSALEAVRNGEVEGAMVPIENSVEGGVNATIDSLSRGQELVIVGEVVIPVQFVLAVREGTRLEDIRSIGTHSHAWAQCRNWVHENLPQAIHVTTASTAAGAAELASGNAAFDAALCSELSAKTYGLAELASGVADNQDAVTRFVAVALPSKLPSATGSDKTTLMVQLGHNEAGGLLEMLEQFSVRGVNLSRIESRPVGDSLGRYAFSIDAEGHVQEERMQAVLIGLHRISPEVRFIGSYPSADRRVIKRRPGTSDVDFVEARAWVNSLLSEGVDLAPADTSAPAGDAKSRILEAAKVEFSRYGFSGASIRQVATLAEVDAGLIGYHYGSKAKLFDAATEGVFQALVDLATFVTALVAKHVDHTDPAGQVSAELMAEFQRVGVSLFDRDLTTILRTVLSATSGSDKTRERVLERLREVLGEGNGDQHAALIAQTVMAMVFGVLFARIVVQVRPLSEISAEDMIKFLSHRFMAMTQLDLTGIAEIPPHVQPTPPEIEETEDTRARILDVARSRFALWGYAGTSLREIASMSRCDISLIHYYFGSKLGLFEATIDVPFPWSGVVHRHEVDGRVDVSAIISELLEMWAHPVQGAVVRSLLSSAADPDTDAVGELVRRRLQRLFDEAIRPQDSKGSDFSRYLVGAEVLGNVIMRDVIGAQPFAKLSDTALAELMKRSVAGDAVLTKKQGA